MPLTASALRDRNLPGLARFVEDAGGLVALEITTGVAHARIFLQGAHLTEWQPVGEAPVLFLSSRSRFVAGQPIRGGVPVIFPWFGPRADDLQAPPHGFARTAEWALETLDIAADQTIRVTLRMNENEATRSACPQPFTLRYRFAIGAELSMSLEVENGSDTPLHFEEALHTYFAVSDVRHVAVSGLAGAEFIDKTDAFRRRRHEIDPLTFSGETDRVFVNTTAVCLLDDPGLNRRITIEKSGSASTIVWNPWAARTLALGDLRPEEWPNMLCIESGNVAENAISLPPGETHTMSVRIALAPIVREPAA